MSEAGLMIPLVSIGIMVLMSSFFSGSETALTAISRARIYHLVLEGNKRAQMVSRIRRSKESLISTILLGNTAVNIGGSALATSLAIDLWGEAGVVYVTLIMTLVVLIVGEVMPKTYAILYTERFALAVAPYILFLMRIFHPINIVIQGTIKVLLRLFGIDLTKKSALVSATDVIRGTIELHHSQGEMVKQDRDMLGSILDLSDIKVGDIMTHRKNVVAIDIDQSAQAIITQAINSGHSRVPLWRGEPDNIIGVLHVKNVLNLISARGQNNIEANDLAYIAAKPWFVPETTTLRHQLLAFRASRQHFALVVDEYGGWLGIATLEDIIEEIVGEIHDEHDIPAAAGFTPRPDGSYQIEGRTTIRDLNRALEWTLPDDSASTIAGLVIHEARQIPEIGATFEMFGYRIMIEDRQANQITRLNIKKLSSETTETL